MNQHLVDYTVRNITTGDEEEIRVLELELDEIAEFPVAVRDEIGHLILDVRALRKQHHAAHAEWDHAQSVILRLLMPYISDRALYDSDYAAWEERVLDVADGVLVEQDKAWARRILDRYPPEEISYRVRKILDGAIDAAIENWQEGYWADFTEASTEADVWGALAGFIQSYVELEPDELSVRFMGPTVEA